jgi:hypothetical protein
MRLISLIALFHKIGFRDDVREEVEALCKIAKCSYQDFIDAIRLVKDSPGFVVQAGRYWYVTPEIVARVLFCEGWERWVNGDPETFLSGLTEHLQQQLIDRAGKLGREEVRVVLASFFRRWFDRLTVRDLANLRVASLAASVIETRPEEYLPKLRSVIDSSEAEDLTEARGDWNGATWGPRRTLVWLLERLVSFPEFFDDCEACLFRLALHETEPQIGNNATAIWQSLFSIYLSGTATPFQKRIGVLRDRMLSQDLDDVRLAFRGLSQAFEGPSGHVIGPPAVAGRLRPHDWQPASQHEKRLCYEAAVILCGEYLSSRDGDRRSLAFNLLVEHIGTVLREGFLDETARLLTPASLRADEARRLVNAVDEFLAFEEQIGRDRSSEQAVRYIQKVCCWANTLRPSDFDGKLRSVCARDPWDNRFAKDARNQSDEIDELANQIRLNPSRLLPHLDWLASHEARSAERLGFSLGRIDENFASGEAIFNQAVRWRTASLLRGYIRGLVFAQRAPSQEILRLTAELEATCPEMAVDILVYGGDSFDGLNRSLRLVESKAVSPRFLASFAMGIGRRELTADEVGMLLTYLADDRVATDADVARAGVRFLFTHLMFEKRRSPASSCLERDDIRSRAWWLVERALPHVESQLSQEWSHIVEQLATHDLDRAAILLGQALLSENLGLRKQAQEQLIKLASIDPDVVMEGFGQALLDPIHGWRLQIPVLRDLAARLSSRSVVTWAQKHGIKAARAIARHLPRPHIDEEGHAVVPEVLDVILRDYDDDQVFNNFIAGVHSGESWWGDASEQFRREAEEATRFLRHRNHRIREWARREIDSRTQMAECEEREHAERVLP